MRITEAIKIKPVASINFDGFNLPSEYRLCIDFRTLEHNGGTGYRLLSYVSSQYLESWGKRRKNNGSLANFVSSAIGWHCFPVNRAQSTSSQYEEGL